MSLTTPVVYVLAAIAEIAGCFAFWAWLRHDKSALWLIPGMACLAAFAWLLTLVDSSAAGRAYAAYGGVYIAASLAWLWAVEGFRPDRWDMAGGVICIVGAVVSPVHDKQLRHRCAKVPRVTDHHFSRHGFSGSQK